MAANTSTYAALALPNAASRSVGCRTPAGGFQVLADEPRNGRAVHLAATRSAVACGGLLCSAKEADALELILSLFVEQNFYSPSLAAACVGDAVGHFCSFETPGTFSYLTWICAKLLQLSLYSVDTL